MFIIFSLFLFIISFLLTGLIRIYAISTNILDVPNHRSSHTTPTPRGGGLSFVLCFLFALVYLSYKAFISPSMALALGGAGSLVAILGFLDDRISLPASWRLLGHVLASGFALLCIDAPILSLSLSIEFIGFFITILYLVWLLNLYNFMDGIDGLAATEASTSCIGMVLIYISTGNLQLIILPIILAAAVMGFLVWNVPSAKIFMGDVGSGFLGIILGLFSLQSGLIQQKFFWCWLILLGVFVVDASVTLARRVLTRQKIFEAHCSHAYQHASQKFEAHGPITLAVGLINVFWLLPMAFLVIHTDISGYIGLIIAYLPLLFLTLYFKAGIQYHPQNVNLVSVS